jgi:hypothetical protein
MEDGKAEFELRMRACVSTLPIWLKEFVYPADTSFVLEMDLPTQPMRDYKGSQVENKASTVGWKPSRWRTLLAASVRSVYLCNLGAKNAMYPYT